MEKMKILIWVLTLFIVSFITLYIITFDGGLSDSQTDWGTFGDYLSGIFAVFNLGVVVLLTLYVSHKENQRIEQARQEQELRYVQEIEFQARRSEMELQMIEARSEKELQVQRKIFISQLRYAELDSLKRLFNKLVYYEDEVKDEVLTRCSEVILTFGVFNQQKHKLFPNLDDSGNLSSSINSSIYDYITILQASKEFNEEFVKKFEPIYTNYLLTTNTYINAIHSFIIDDL